MPTQLPQRRRDGQKQDAGKEGGDQPQEVNITRNTQVHTCSHRRVLSAMYGCSHTQTPTHTKTPNISTDENINKNKYVCWNYSFYPQPHTANWGNATTQ